MKIEILYGIEGAKKAKGIVVIIDVFRAGTVEAYIMQKGAKTIIAVENESIAYKFKNKNNDIIIVGERNGKIIPGFDYGNSPAQIEHVNFNGKTVIHKTTSGTRAIVNVKNANEVLIGSFVNVNAICRYIKNVGCNNVSLVCSGTEFKNEDHEDYICAQYIKNLLEDKKMNILEKINELRNNRGLRFFNKETQEDFPKRDFYLCTDINKYNFILKKIRSNNKISYIEKYDVTKGMEG